VAGVPLTGRGRRLATFQRPADLRLIPASSGHSDLLQLLAQRRGAPIDRKGPHLAWKDLEPTSADAAERRDRDVLHRIARARDAVHEFDA
jgi:hypothetical protein